MCADKNLWEKAVEFHGHACPGLAVGYRAAEIALEHLNSMRSVDEELVAIVENDACGVDAVMVLTGCTLGKGNLLYRDLGKSVYTFGSRSSNRALRISVDDTRVHPSEPQKDRLRDRISAGTATEEEIVQLEQERSRWIQQLLHMPEEEFCKVEQVDFQFPSKAQLFPSVQCAGCGEYVMEPRARVRDGNIVCLDCFEDYNRGW